MVGNKKPDVIILHGGKNDLCGYHLISDGHNCFKSYKNINILVDILDCIYTIKYETIMLYKS